MKNYLIILFTVSFLTASTDLPKALLLPLSSTVSNPVLAVSINNYLSTKLKKSKQFNLLSVKDIPQEYQDSCDVILCAEKYFYQNKVHLTKVIWLKLTKLNKTYFLTTYIISKNGSTQSHRGYILPEDSNSVNNLLNNIINFITIDEFLNEETYTSEDTPNSTSEDTYTSNSAANDSGYISIKHVDHFTQFYCDSNFIGEGAGIYKLSIGVHTLVLNHPFLPSKQHVVDITPQDTLLIKFPDHRKFKITISAKLGITIPANNPSYNFTIGYELYRRFQFGLNFHIYSNSFIGGGASFRYTLNSPRRRAFLYGEIPFGIWKRGNFFFTVPTIGVQFGSDEFRFSTDLQLFTGKFFLLHYNIIGLQFRF